MWTRHKWRLIHIFLIIVGCKVGLRRLQASPSPCSSALSWKLGRVGLNFFGWLFKPIRVMLFLQIPLPLCPDFLDRWLLGFGHSPWFMFCNIDTLLGLDAGLSQVFPVAILHAILHEGDLFYLKKQHTILSYHNDLIWGPPSSKVPFVITVPLKWCFHNKGPYSNNWPHPLINHIR